ncbi:MAG: hypothetical protein K2L30_08615 [Duncaniella sp.]|nr:hypothetical protein [Duncaniella sp.]
MKRENYSGIMWPKPYKKPWYEKLPKVVRDILAFLILAPLGFAYCWLDNKTLNHLPSWPFIAIWIACPIIATIIFIKKKDVDESIFPSIFLGGISGFFIGFVLNIAILFAINGINYLFAKDIHVVVTGELSGREIVGHGKFSRHASQVYLPELGYPTRVFNDDLYRSPIGTKVELTYKIGYFNFPILEEINYPDKTSPPQDENCKNM